MLDTVRIGIVGIGNMGSAHAKSIFAGNVKDLVLGAVCDIAPEKLAWARENLPDVPCFSDYHEMLASGRSTLFSLQRRTIFIRKLPSPDLRRGSMF